MSIQKNRRELLLDSAFKTFYKQGFQGANITSILNDVNINKGSMYHYFKSKKELGLAVVEERIERNILKKYKTILEGEKSVENMFDTLRSAPELLPYGCPLNKMSQEMLYIDKEFQERLSKVYAGFESIVNQILIKDAYANTARVTKLIIATYEGALSMYHLNQDKLAFREVLTTLENEISHKFTKRKN